MTDAAENGPIMVGLFSPAPCGESSGMYSRNTRPTHELFCWCARAVQPECSLARV